MTKLGNIQSSYGKSISVAIANTTAENIINSSNLPTNTLIIGQAYNSSLGEDEGSPSILITDYEGSASIVSYHIKEKNGFVSSQENPNSIYLHIDNNTIKEKNGQLSVDINNIIDNSTLVYNENSLNINIESLDKASKDKYGVLKVDNNTIKSDNGNLYIDTSKLDLANQQLAGIVKPDNNTIKVSGGVLSVDINNLSKASMSSYGIVKPDNDIIESNNGSLYINKNKLKYIDKDGYKLAKVDNTTIVSTNGVLSINEDNLPKASQNNLGVVKIDSNTLELDTNNILHIKDLSQNFTYIYDLEDGITQVESRISSIRNLIDNNEFGQTTPNIQSLSCNQTTTTVLAKPEYLEEPINMQLQHIYVSLNVITNCDFDIDIDYIDNIVPCIELDNINYNDEYSISGVEALEHVWESTKMKEKTIVLLFNSKNFYSSTDPKVNTTKINISITAKQDITQSKTITYSIIRYNSFFNDKEIGDEVEQISLEANSEYIVNETESEWLYINISHPSFNLSSLSSNSPCVINHKKLNGSSEESIISSEIIKNIKNNPSSLALYLKGAYTELSSGETYIFYQQIDVSIFNTEVSSQYNRAVYDFPYKIKFDTLYYQLQYQIDRHLRFIIKDEDSLNSKTLNSYSYHSNQVQFGLKSKNPSGEYSYISSINSDINSWTSYNNILLCRNTYLYYDNSIITSSLENQNSSFIFRDSNMNNILEFSMPIERIDDYSIMNLTLNDEFSYSNSNILYFINCTETLESPVLKETLDNYINDNKGVKIILNKYKTYFDSSTYLSFPDSHIIYNTQMNNVSLFTNIIYQFNNFPKTIYTTQSFPDPENCLLQLSYGINTENNNYEQYYANYYPTQKQLSNIVSSYSYLSSIETSYISYSASYWFEYNGNKFIGLSDETLNPESYTYLNIELLSEPKVVLSGFSYSLTSNNENLNISFSNDFLYSINNVYSIDNINCQDHKDWLANSVYISYSYIDNPISINTNNDFKFINNETIQVPNNFLNSTYKLFIKGLTTLETTPSQYNIYEKEISIGSNQNILIDNNFIENSSLIFSYIYYESSDIHSNIISYINYPENISNDHSISFNDTHTYFYNSDGHYYKYVYLEGCLDSYMYIHDNSYFRNNSYILSGINIIPKCSYAIENTFPTIINVGSSIDPCSFSCIIDHKNKFKRGTDSYFSYLDNENLFFYIGYIYTLNNSNAQTLDNYKSNLSITSYLSYNIGDSIYQSILDYAFIEEISSDYTVTNIIGYTHIDNNSWQENDQIFVSSFAYYQSSDFICYYNSYFTEAKYYQIELENENIIHTFNIPQTSFYKDSLVKLFTNILGDPEYSIENNSNLVLYVYQNGNLICSICNGDNTSELLYNSNSDHDNSNFICEIRPTNITQSFAYSYYIPNISNIIHKYDLTKYYKFIVPSVNICFDQYFNPYDFTIDIELIRESNSSSYISNYDKVDDENIISCSFYLNYDNRLISKKEYSQITFLDENFSGSQYTTKHLINEDRLGERYYSYAYYNYIKYAYSQILSYCDTKYYIPFDSSNDDTVYIGSRRINFTNEESMYSLLPLNKILSNSDYNVYITYFDNEDQLKYIWTYNNIDETTSIYQYDFSYIDNENVSITPISKNTINSISFSNSSSQNSLPINNE